MTLIAGYAALLLLAASSRAVDADVPPVPEPKTVGSPQAQALFLTGGDFEEAAPFDTGLVARRCVNLSPWGERGWGVGAATFGRDEPNHALEGLRLRVFDDGGNRVAGIFAKESRGLRIGYARFVQGDAWGGTLCPGNAAVGWRRPEPLGVAGRRLALTIDVKNEQVWKFSNRLLRGGVGGTSQVMVAFNVWLSSPRLAKRAVLDLAVVHDCNWGPGDCGPNTDEGAKAFHYIVHVAKDGKDSAKGRWVRWLVDLQRHIEGAARRFGWDRGVVESLAITQVDFLVEVMDGQGSVLFDNVRLLDMPEGSRLEEGGTPLP
ncbi:MAG: hypothetical protein HY553_21055 [Elusimicrobia bacterium]|nr:hypothetical protein [Elusimicrobiota bacterium]